MAEKKSSAKVINVEKATIEKNETIRREALARVLSSVSSIITSRVSYGGTQTFGGLRDVYATLGYPALDKINFQDFYMKYRRDGVAAKIIEKPVEASWRRLPLVHGENDEDETFKDTWEILQKAKGIYQLLIRADIISGIGKYGIILLGFNDAGELNTPVEKASELLYLQPFTSDGATISKYVTDNKDPRYGLPEFYSVKLAQNPGSASSADTQVHWSRIIHIAENLRESNVEGLPRLERVFNRLLDLDQIVGGSAEMFWQGAFPGLAFKGQEGVDLTDATLRNQLEDEIKKYVHRLERYLKLQGIDVQSLAPQVADPKSHVDTQLRMVAIGTGIPKRIFEGSERGELSSSQDTEAWDDMMDGRRRFYIEPVILRPLIDKLIAVGVLKTPANGYYIEWPDLSAPSDKDKSEIGKNRSEAIKNYFIAPDTRLGLTFESFLKEVLEFPEEKVERIMLEIQGALEGAMGDDGAGDDAIGMQDGTQSGTPPNDPTAAATTN